MIYLAVSCFPLEYLLFWLLFVIPTEQRNFWEKLFLINIRFDLHFAAKNFVYIWRRRRRRLINLNSNDLSRRSGLRSRAAAEVGGQRRLFHLNPNRIVCFWIHTKIEIDYLGHKLFTSSWQGISSKRYLIQFSYIWVKQCG